MTNASVSPSTFALRSTGPTANDIFRVVGITCIVGFAVNILTVAIPPDPMALEWRIGFMQQVSGRSILLFLGIAMVVYGSLGQRIVRLLALACLVVGLLYLLSGVVVIRDGLVLQNQTLRNIESEATEIRSQLQTAQNTPNLSPDVTPERIDEALIQLETQAEALTQNAQSATTKAMISVLSTQVVIGVGLLALGRFGIRQSTLNRN